MKPELILQSDILDILFYGRNKEYGAYSLRKQYNGRLTKAVTATFAFAFLLSLSWYFQANYLKSDRSTAAGQPVADVHLQNLDETKKPPEPKQPKPEVRKQVAQIPNTTITIVPDNKADKSVPKNKELNNKLISTMTSEGDDYDGNMLAPTGFEGDKSGSVIEPVKEEAEVKITPLVKAEVMPEFPGGLEAFKKFMLRNLRQPNDLEEGEKVVVLIKFIVEADGTIVNADVLKSGGRFDDEVLKVVKKMPRWKPGMQNGKFVPVYFNLPVTFAGSGN